MQFAKKIHGNLVNSGWVLTITYNQFGVSCNSGSIIDIVQSDFQGKCMSTMNKHNITNKPANFM